MRLLSSFCLCLSSLSTCFGLSFFLCIVFNCLRVRLGRGKEMAGGALQSMIDEYKELVFVCLCVCASITGHGAVWVCSFRSFSSFFFFLLLLLRWVVSCLCHSLEKEGGGDIYLSIYLSIYVSIYREVCVTIWIFGAGSGGISMCTRVALACVELCFSAGAGDGGGAVPSRNARRLTRPSGRACPW